PFNSAPPPAVLTIEPGVIIKFNAGTGLNIGSGANAGGLVAQGTAASPIVFTANQTFPLSGAWKGITFADATTAGSLIERAVVEYGGLASGAAILESVGQAPIRFTQVRGSLNYGIRITGGAAPLLENLTIQNTGAAALRFETSSPTLRNSLVQTSGGYGVSVSGANSSVLQNNTLDHGIFFDNASGNPVITGNTFERYAGFPIQVGADDVGEVLAQNTIHGSTGSDTLQMMGERVQTTATWSNPGFPLVVVNSNVPVYGDLVSPVTLTLAAGVQIRFAQFSYLQIGSGANRGALIAQGTPAAPILLTSNLASPAAGNWGGVFFDDGADDATSVLDRVTISYAGYLFSSAVRASSASPTVRNSIVVSSSVYGVYLSGSNAVVEDNSISLTGSNGIRSDGAGSPALRRNTITSPTGYGLYISGANSAQIEDNVVANAIFFDNAGGNPFIDGNTFSNFDANPPRLGADDVAEFLNGNTLQNASGAGRLEVMGEVINTSGTWPATAFPLNVISADIVVGNSPTTPVVLTIAPGAVLRFASGIRLEVGTTVNRGGLVAAGTPAQPILFTTSNAAPAAGQWQGIYFDTFADTATSLLDRCTIEYAGQTYSANVRIVASAPTIRNSTVRNSSVYGIYGTSSPSPIIQGNTFANNVNFDVYMSGTSNAQVTSNTFTSAAFFDTAAGTHAVTGNIFNGYNNAAKNLRVGAHAVAGLGTNTFNGTGSASLYEILGETLTADASWPSVGFPGVVLQDTVVAKDAVNAATLTLSPGVVLRFNASTGLFIGTTVNKGALVAAGTAAQPITFTTNNATPAPGQWEGVYFDSMAVSATSLLDHVVAEYAGQTYSGDVRLIGVSPIIRNSTFRNSSVYGVYGTSSPSPTISNNTFTGNVNFDVYMSGTSNAQVTGNTFASAVFFDTAAGTHAVTGNTFNAYNNAARNLRVGMHAAAGLGSNTFAGTGTASTAELLSETLASNASWAPLGFPYIALGDIIVAKDPTTASVLTLQAGVSIRFVASVALFVGTTVNRGALVVNGTAAQPVLFTTNNATPAPGQWQGIYFDSQSDGAASLIDHAIVEYAGQTYSGDIRLIGVSPTIRNSTLRNSSVYGIYGTASPSPAIQNNTFSGNTNLDVLLSGTSNAQVTGNTFTSAMQFDTAAGTHAVTGNTFNTYNNAARNLRVGAHAAPGLSTNTFNGTGTASAAEILSETIATDATWNALGFPYLPLSDLVVAKDPINASTLTLAPGVTMKFNAGTGLFIGTTVNKGALVAAGTVAQPITFTTNNATPAPGQWEGVYFDSMAVSATSLLDHVVVEYAGQTYSGDVRLIGVAPTIRNSTFRNSSVYGLYGTSQPSPLVQTNTFSGNVNYDAFFDGGSATVTGNTFAHALRFDSITGTPVVTNNTFNSYVGPFLLRFGADAVDGMSGNVFNGADATSKVELLGETLSANARWRLLSVPYAVLTSNVVVSGTFTTPARLTIDPGVTVRFGASLRLIVATGTTQADLVAQGTVAQPITFTTDNAAPAAGQWQGIYLDNGTAFDSVIENVVIEYAGQGSTAGLWLNRADTPVRNSIVRFSSSYGIVLADSSSVVQNVQVTNTGNYGILMQGNAAERFPSITGCTINPVNAFNGLRGQGTMTPTITGNTITNAAFFESAAGRPVIQNNIFNNYDPFPIRVGADSIGILTGNTFNGTGAQSRIEVLGETLTSDATWANLGMPYQLFTTSLTIAKNATQGALLTIAPGVTLKFSAGLGLFVGSSSNKGALAAVGTQAQPILFTTANAAPAPGQWQAVYFDGSTVDDQSILDFCTVEYGGATQNADVVANNANPTIRRSVMRRSLQHGLLLTSASPAVTFNQFLDNTLYGVAATGASFPVLQHNAFTGNVSGAVSNTATSIVDARLNWYGNASGPAGSGPGTGQGVTTNIAF
ncbi:MAG TPA: right-handed parallel beta-helix repeat-containing protein, partial [Candidatus Polarisedimenticolia bacterium]|nr:right-handed parallel beta-helix repeat-containing protein [Candidatus Polarisedimenticolia bacterium]